MTKEYLELLQDFGFDVNDILVADNNLQLQVDIMNMLLGDD